MVQSRNPEVQERVEERKRERHTFAVKQNSTLLIPLLIIQANLLFANDMYHILFAYAQSGYLSVEKPMGAIMVMTRQRAIKT